MNDLESLVRRAEAGELPEQRMRYWLREHDAEIREAYSNSGFYTVAGSVVFENGVTWLLYRFYDELKGAL